MHTHTKAGTRVHTHACAQNASERTTRRTFSARGLTRGRGSQGSRRKPGSGARPESSRGHAECPWQRTPSGAVHWLLPGVLRRAGLASEQLSVEKAGEGSVQVRGVSYGGSGSLCHDKDGRVSVSPQTGSLGVMTRAERKAGRLGDRRQIIGSRVPRGQLVLPSQYLETVESRFHIKSHSGPP